MGGHSGFGGGRRRAATVVVGALLAAVLSLLVQGTAHACSCMQPEARADIDRAEVIFVGTPTKRVEPTSDDGSVNSAAPVTWTFDVTTVHRGSATARTAVDSALMDASCGLTFSLGREYLVFARTVGHDYEILDRTAYGHLGADLCSGTMLLADADAERLGLLGDGVPPEPDPTLAAGNPGPSPWLLGIVIVMLAAGAVVMVRLRRGRSDPRLD